ncbi:toxin glutamine deamidase domain-containing protein [Actinomadura sp. B10D3]|uniref:toxin glutamine deamidase domain-containing protein n=1 Tax=Actinomadura sp. B10D3 TaxID=3153557 RepID=UPI00325DB37C
MGIEQPGGTDTHAEDADKPQAPERPPGPPPDRPGQPGFPSRIESRRAAREAQEARAAELASRQAAPPESGTEQDDEPDEKTAESSPTEPASEQQDTQDDHKDAEEPTGNSKSESETGSGLDEHDASTPEPESAEATRPDEPAGQTGTTDNDELAPDTGAEPPENAQDQAEPPPADAAEDPEEPTEAGDAGDQPAADPEAGQVGRPDGPGEEGRAQDADEVAPRPPGEREQVEPRDRQPLPQQDSQTSETGDPGSEAAAGQILQAERQSGLLEQASQDAPDPVPTVQPDGPSDSRPANEGEMRRAPDRKFQAAEPSEQSGRSDAHVEDTEKPPIRDRPPAPPHDRPGQPGYPSRLESLRSAREAQEVRAGEMENRQTIAPKNNAEQQNDPVDAKGPEPLRAEDRPHSPATTGNSSETKGQREIGEKMAELAERKVVAEINEALDKVNPKFDVASSAYSENCTGVVQANELRRRGEDVEAGPLEKHLRTDEGGPGGRSVSTIEKAWGGTFVPGARAEIEEAFKQPGSRGIVYIAWNGAGGGAHVFSVENVGGKVHFVDGQPTPPVRDASHYFALGRATEYLRVDDLPTPARGMVDPYLEP